MSHPDTIQPGQSASERLYEALVDSIDGIVCELDGLSFQVIFVSKQAERILGYPVEQWLTEPNFWLNHLHPDDRARAFDAETRAVSSKQNVQLEYRMIAADGHVVWFRDVVTVTVEDGNSPRLRGVKIDITDRKRAEEQLEAANHGLRSLTARVNELREEESIRIARELHDELGSMLASLKWDLASLGDVCGRLTNGPQQELVRTKIESMRESIDTTIGAVRRIASELRPSELDLLGLPETIEAHLKDFQSRTGIVCNVDWQAESIAFGREQSTALFRIFQEAITNILRHAHATKVDVSLRAEDREAVLTITDNGRGIPASAVWGESLGLLGMRERAQLIGGTVEVTGAAGQGTIVRVRVPVA